jgi:hypothetical protein
MVLLLRFCLLRKYQKLQDKFFQIKPQLLSINWIFFRDLIAILCQFSILKKSTTKIKNEK